MILITIYHKDQSITKYVSELEDLRGGPTVTLQLASASVQSITIDKHSKQELKEMGYTKTGKQ